MKNLCFLQRVKSLLKLTCVLSLSILAMACQEDAPPRISLSTETMSFGFTRDAQTVEVTSNYPWTATILPAEAASWCSLSLSSSILNTETLKVYVEDNLPVGTQTEERHATIIFSTEGNGSNPAATLHISQSIKPEEN